MSPAELEQPHDLPKTLFSDKAWNVTRLPNNLFIGRVSSLEAERPYGADATVRWVLDSKGNLLYPLCTQPMDGVLQYEDDRVLSDGSSVVVSCNTTVLLPADKENGQVTWCPGISILAPDANGTIYSQQQWAFPGIKGKNATPVSVGRGPDDSLQLVMDMRHDNQPHMLSRYAVALFPNGEVDFRHVRDNEIPQRWWNLTIAGTGGSLVQHGAAGLYVGFLHGQVEESGIRKYYLGRVICDALGRVVYLSKDPVLSPENIPGDDLRGDVVALYTTDSGEIIFNTSNAPIHRILVSRGDKVTYACDISFTKGEMRMLNGESVEIPTQFDTIAS